ncbi:MAG: hypothetical protein WKG07_20995 [Hymenobacter sp.]
MVKQRRAWTPARAVSNIERLGDFRLCGRGHRLGRNLAQHQGRRQAHYHRLRRRLLPTAPCCWKNK